ncbi:hypothetical protein ACQKC9_11150 [Psychrobacter sp. NPDC078409]|uniref:hypothetical protein n=1 Tax=Psychrobacter sp. NPDC078409 TaxID=3390660 RepID=UPI003D086BDC
MKTILIILGISLILLVLSSILGWVSISCKSFEGLSVLYGAMTAATVAISLALYNHIDTIIKDIPEKLKDKNESFYVKSIDSLTLLKKEALSNTFLAVVNICLYFSVRSLDVFSCNTESLLSYINLLVSIFTFLAFVYMIFDLIKAFQVSAEYRSIIKKG